MSKEKEQKFAVPVKDLNRTTKGILCIIAAAFGFALMGFFVKLAGNVPVMEKAFFRNAFAAIVAFILIIREGQGLKIKKGNGRDIFFRCLFGTSGLICNFFAIEKLGIADASMLNKLSPFFAILLSIPVLKEKPKKIDILATVLAFTGALFIVRPRFDMSVIPGLLGLYGGFGAGFAYVFVRRLGGKGERTSIIVLCFSLFSCAICVPFALPVFVMPTPAQFTCLVMAGLSATLGQFGITSAYKFAPAKEISVFDYTQVIFSALLGIFFLSEIPSLLSIAGYIIIIGTAVMRWRYTLIRDRRNKEQGEAAT